MSPGVQPRYFDNSTIVMNKTTRFRFLAPSSRKQTPRLGEVDSETLGHFLYSRICPSKRPFSTEAHIEFSSTVEKGPFRLDFFRLRIHSDWRMQPKNSTFSTGSPSRKTQSKPRFLDSTAPHGNHSTPQHSGDAGLAAVAAAVAHLESAWRISSSARERQASYDGYSPRHR